MYITLFTKDYLIWHYGQAINDIWEIYKNFLWFGYHLFSMPLILKTIFSPFYRIRESYHVGLDLEAFLENLVANIATRAVGFILRIFVFVMGVVFEVFITLSAIIFFLLWLLLPSIILGLLLSGVAFLL